MSPTGRDKYGRAHRELRARWAPKVARGEVNCARCTKKIEAGEPWHLGHDDSDPDRRKYSGPEHVRCNTATRAHQPPRKRPSEPHPGLIIVTTPGGAPLGESRQRPLA